MKNYFLLFLLGLMACQQSNSQKPAETKPDSPAVAQTAETAKTRELPRPNWPALKTATVNPADFEKPKISPKKTEHKFLRGKEMPSIFKQQAVFRDLAEGYKQQEEELGDHLVREYQYQYYLENGQEVLHGSACELTAAFEVAVSTCVLFDQGKPIRISTGGSYALEEFMESGGSSSYYGYFDQNGELESVQLHLENAKGECLGSPKIPSRGLKYPEATQLWFIDEKHKVDKTLKKIPCK